MIQIYQKRIPNKRYGVGLVGIGLCVFKLLALTGPTKKAAFGEQALYDFAGEKNECEEAQ